MRAYADVREASSHSETKHVSVKSANKRHRARRVLRTTADGALGDIEGGAPGTGRIGGELVTGGVDHAQVCQELTCSRNNFQRDKEFLFVQTRGWGISFFFSYSHLTFFNIFIKK